MIGVWTRLAEIVAAQGAAALVTVHAAQGSAPREAGARLVMRPDGAFHGTIGGGRLEWEALRWAREALSQGRGPARFVEQVLGPDLGQCCGGRVTLLVETFGREDAAALRGLEGGGELICCLDDVGRVERAAHPPPSAGEGQLAKRAGRGAVTRMVQDERSGRAWFGAARVTDPSPCLPAAGGPSPAEGGGWAWREPSPEQPTPFLLFGAGHVGRALVLALAPLPFALRWIDTRPDAFPLHVPANATPVRTADPEAEIAAAAPGAFVLVMTHDHALDLAVTAAALQRPDLPFVGLIGSATKRARFERRLRAIRVPEARIARLACPIGVPGIAGKEPAVIAAAVTAQLLIERESLCRASLGPLARAAG